MPKNENRRRTVWFPDTLWGKISAAAAQDNRTVSNWLRDRADAALSREARRVVKKTDMDAFDVRP